MPAKQIDDSHWRPKHNAWIIALTVTLATFMEVLDTSIANVALPHIAGGLGASQNESTWVLTSYLVSNAIILPISAWLARSFGRKRFYMTCVALFTASSFLCGLAPSLGMLIVFRVLQGAGGGGLAPSEQAILADTFHPSMRGMAFAIYGMAVVVAPAIGPTLGGWITDNYSWRWIFYINIPVGLLSLLLTHRLVEDPPYLTNQREKSRHSKIDLTGLGLVAIAMGCLQMVLDKGQESDWFASHWITALFIIAMVTLVVWIFWEWRHKDPIVDLHLFKHRNFAVAMLITFFLGVVLFSTTVVIPQFLQELLGYTAFAAGEALAGGGLVMMVMMPISGFLVSRVDPRKMMAFGFLSTAAALYFITTHLTLQMDFKTAALLRTFQTVGLAFIFLPSNTLAYADIPREKYNQVSSLNAFIRNIGGSIGIAVVTDLVTRQAQKHQNYLVPQISNFNLQYRTMVNGISNSLQNAGLNASDADRQAIGRISGMVHAQARTLSYIDVMSMLAVIIVCLTPLVLLMKYSRPPRGAEALH